MNILLLPLLISIITTFVAISILRPFAVSIDLIDKPNSRKKHVGSVPLIGGIAMYFGVVISILVTSTDLNQLNYFLLSTGIIVMVGVLDDHRDISVSLRIFFQALVSIIVVTVGGVLIGSFGNLLGGGDIVIGKWAYFITIISIIAGMNAVNMTDGIHGLAGGNSLITFLGILYLSLDGAAQENILIALLFCSVLPVFLIYNLCFGLSENKRIFMGDAGSMLIGLTIAWLLVDLSQGGNRAFSPVTALWLFAMPLFEMVFAILRRLTSGKSPFKPDISHTHHILVRLGIREEYALLFVLLTSLLMTLIGILGEQYGATERVMFIGFLLAFGIYIISYITALKKSQINAK